MSRVAARLLYWSPGTFSIAFAIFLSLFALDVFNEVHGFLADRARVFDPPYPCDSDCRCADRCMAMGMDRHGAVFTGRYILRRVHVVQEHQ